MAEKATGERQGCGWLVVGAVVFALFLSRCTSKSEQAETSSASTWADGATPAPTSTPTAVLALVGASVHRGSQDFRLTMAVPGGDKIYSENCYAALRVKFSWPKLDACGTFDELAIQRMNDSSFAGTSDMQYFDPETAAGRYLVSATSHGATTESADERLAALQRMSAKAKTPVRAPPALEDVTDDAKPSEDVVPSPAPDDNSVEDTPVAAG